MPACWPTGSTASDGLVAISASNAGTGVCGRFAVILPLCSFRNKMVFFKMVALSTLPLLVATIARSSFSSMLKWSRRLFSFKFRDFLQFQYNTAMRTNDVTSTSTAYLAAQRPPHEPMCDSNGIALEFAQPPLCRRQRIQPCTPSSTNRLASHCSGSALSSMLPLDAHNCGDPRLARA